MDTWILTYSLHYNPILLYLFYCSNCSSFGYWEIFQLSPMLLWQTLSLRGLERRGTLPYFLMLLDTLECISCLSPGISHFSKALVPSIWDIIKNQDLGGRWTHRYWDTSLPFKIPVWQGKKKIPDHNITLSLETLIGMSNNLSLVYWNSCIIWY